MTYEHKTCVQVRLKVKVKVFFRLYFEYEEDIFCVQQNE